jgi:uncharacterized protein with HEPN domain
MMSDRDASALLDMYRAAGKVVEFSRGYDQRAFLADERTQSAVLHQLLIIGEAVKRLSAGFRAQHPQIRWSPMAGMRDVLIHAYDTVDLDQVWRTVTNEVPALIASLQPLLPDSLQE